MSRLSGWQRFYSHEVLRSVVLVLLCIELISCSTPTQAGSSQPTDAQLQAKVLQIIRDNPQVIIESVQGYQQKQQSQQQQAQKAFLQQMKADPKSVIGDSPTTGSPEQKIVLLEFSDFQCPFCAKAHETIKQFIAGHKDKVTLTYKHLPLTQIHPEAMPAAKAAWAAGQQGKFWEFHDAMFTQQKQLGEPLYVATAKALNLDLKRFDQDRNSDAASKAIQKDVEMAEKLGVPGTPFLLMNGEPVPGNAQVKDMEAFLTKLSKS